MQKVLSFFVVASLAMPVTFAATADGLGGTSTATAISATPSPKTGISLGENKEVSCSSNAAFGTNSCDQCFDGGSVTVGKKLTGLFDNWTNNSPSLMVAYQNEQKKPNMVSFGSTVWTSSPTDESKVWKNSSDIVWTPSQSGSTKMQYILGAGQKVRFVEADLGAGYTLDKTDRKNGDLVGMLRYPVVSHVIDASANEGLAKTHYECVAYNLSAPVVTTPTNPSTPTTPTTPVKPINPDITKTETGPTETIMLILAAFFIAFGLMFSLRKRI